MKKLFVLIAVALCLSGCLKLDSNLYNQSKLASYKFDSYSGTVDFKLDDSYSMSAIMVHLFTLSSQAAGESKPTKIYAVYLGDISHIATDTVIMYCHGNKDHRVFY